MLAEGDDSDFGCERKTGDLKGALVLCGAKKFGIANQIFCDIRTFNELAVLVEPYVACIRNSVKAKKDKRCAAVLK